MDAPILLYEGIMQELAIITAPMMRTIYLESLQLKKWELPQYFSTIHFTVRNVVVWQAQRLAAARRKIMFS